MTTTTGLYLTQDLGVRFTLKMNFVVTIYALKDRWVVPKVTLYKM